MLAAILVAPHGVSAPASAQVDPITVPSPCDKEPCGLAIDEAGRRVNLEPMNEEARDFIRRKLVPAISRRISASDYFRRKQAEKHCQVTFRIVIAPSKAVGLFNLQTRDELFFEEFAKVVRDAVEQWKGRIPDDVFDKPFMMTVGFSLLPCRPMK